jgi:hypothetical protein
MRSPDALPPWSPLSVALIAFLLPAGGIVVTIQNMYRLQVLDRAQAYRMAVGAMCIVAVGLGIILGIAPTDKSGQPIPPSGAELILSIAAAALAIAAHRGPFERWRSAHRVEATASWLRAAGWALLYTAGTGLMVVPVALIVEALVGQHTGVGTRL